MFGKYKPIFFISLTAKLIAALFDALTPISSIPPSVL